MPPHDRITLRRVLAACALLVLVGFHVEFFVMPRSFFTWRALHRGLTASPDGPFQEYALFLEDVRQHTKPGDRISVVIPRMNTDDYRYAYYRASYILAGREVLPLYYRTIPHPENLGRVDYLAVWHAPIPPARIVGQGHGGVLLSRR